MRISKRVKINAPCMNCPYRAVGCHGSCEDYKKYQSIIRKKGRAHNVHKW